MDCFIVYIPHQMQFICLLSSVKMAKEEESVLGTWSQVILLSLLFQIKFFRSCTGVTPLRACRVDTENGIYFQAVADSDK